MFLGNVNDKVLRTACRQDTAQADIANLLKLPLELATPTVEVGKWLAIAPGHLVLDSTNNFSLREIDK